MPRGYLLQEPGDRMGRGKEIAIVGGTNGIGRALARKFAAHGARVIVVGRTFRDQGVERLRFIPANLSEMKQAQRVAEDLPGLPKRTFYRPCETRQICPQE